VTTTQVEVVHAIARPVAGVVAVGVGLVLASVVVVDDVEVVEVVLVGTGPPLATRDSIR